MPQQEDRQFRFRAGYLDYGAKTLLMGILNITPDSFSDGGLYFTKEAALRQAQKMRSAGADLIDIGGESTRPGSTVLPAQVELERIQEVIFTLAQEGFVLSVDTWKAEVAAAALEAGAQVINDIFALQGDRAMAAVVARYQAGLILMNHPAYYRPERKESQVFPARPQLAPLASELKRELAGRDIVSQSRLFLRYSLDLATKAGIPASHIMLDPGLGFGLDLAENLRLCVSSNEIAQGYPVLVAPSRKRFIRSIVGAESEAVESGTAAVAVWALAQGAAMLRLHDVERHAPLLKMGTALQQARNRGGVVQC